VEEGTARVSFVDESIRTIFGDEVQDREPRIQLDQPPHHCLNGCPHWQKEKVYPARSNYWHG
jgi:hypothetical protein